MNPNYVHIHLIAVTELLIPELPCMCASLRRAARTVSQLYDDALRPLGLRATQFTLLQALSLSGELTQGELGRMLALDSTTLTRTLENMTKNGWIVKRRGEDRREWHIRLSDAGKAELKRALPLWRKVQREMRTRLGDAAWQDLLKLTNKATESGRRTEDL